MDKELEFVKFLVDLQKKVDKLEQEVEDLQKNNTYNITINTHGYEKSPNELAENIIKGIKAKGSSTELKHWTDNI